VTPSVTVAEVLYTININNAEKFAINQQRQWHLKTFTFTSN